MNSSTSPFWHTRALVLGASGFIGYWVSRALRAQGAHLTCAVRTVADAERLTSEHLGSVVVRRDLSDLELLSSWIPALRPAIVFNLAGYGVDRAERDEAEADRMNHRFTAALGRVVSTLPHDQWQGLRLVHVGSALEYGTTGGELTEGSECAPTTVYGRSKLAGTLALQAIARDTGLDACIARCFTVFGPGEHPGRLLPTLLGAAADGTAVPLSDGLQRRDFTYVEDVAEGLLRLAVSDAAPGEIVHLASGEMHTVRAFAEVAASLIHLPHVRLHFGAIPVRPEEMRHDGVSVTRLRTLTRWSPTGDLAEGVARTVGRLSEANQRRSVATPPAVRT